jgi:hypothetical protein
MKISSIKIGNMTLIGQCLLPLRDEQCGEITIADGYSIKITIHSSTKTDSPESKLSWNSIADGIAIDAWAWNNVLGESLMEPIAIAKNNLTGKNVYIFLANYKIGVINMCDVAIMEGE